MKKQSFVLIPLSSLITFLKIVHSFVRSSQRVLHAFPTSLSLRPHLQPLRVAFICLLVDCVSQWPLE